MLDSIRKPGIDLSLSFQTKSEWGKWRVRSKLRLAVAFCCIAAGLLAVSKAFAGFDLIPGTIIKVSDGDTVRIQPDRLRAASISIRVIGIDSAELHLPDGRGHFVSQGYWGEQGFEQMKYFVPVGTHVVVQSHGLDKYGRTLGRIIRGRSDINLAMVRSGWAYPYIICQGPECTPEFFKVERVALYLKACAEARANGRGVFNPQKPLMELPLEFRMRIQGRKPEKFVGDFVTKALYAPEEYKKVDVCRAIFFMSAADARRAGYR